ncbi:hypothetical protein [Microlunatus speluncae]|uniref:hypothetical protein n=1 Tax=Microlunatus speluncae TaxID=2594267 RepID=UPI0012664CD7|nr:hypothetical protein [Microlunatus speluncae]
MRFALVDHEQPGRPAPQAEVLLQRGGTSVPADGGYRWFATWLGGDQPTAIGFAHDGLELHGIAQVPSREARLTAWALRLWRPSDAVTMVCCVAEIDRLSESAREPAIRVLLDRLAGYGESTAVIIAGWFTTSTANRLVAGGQLHRVAPGEDRILIAPGIAVAGHDPTAGVVDLTIRHRRELIDHRRWTRPGAEVTEVSWWYQPERSAGVRCASYAEASERLAADTWGPGTISVTYVLQDPDGTRLETTTGAGSEAAGLRPGDRVLNRRLVVHALQSPTRFDDVAEALRCAWAWAAKEVAEELTLGRDAASAVTLPGDRIKITPEWRS